MGMLAILAPIPAMAAEGTLTLELRPHCEAMGWSEDFGGPVPDNPFMTKPVAMTCPGYEIKDPQTRQTPVLRNENVLDMDLVVKNPAKQSIARVRSWIAYDPSLLEGQDITIHPSFSMPSPDEQTFSAQDGTIKIGASTDSASSESEVIVARIRMRVKATTDSQTVLSFINATGAETDETAVVTTQAGAERSLLVPPLGSLLVRMTGGFGAASAAPLSSAAAASIPAITPTVSSAAGTTGTAPSVVDVSALASSGAASSLGAGNAASSAQDASSSAAGGIFTLLQVQNLRATTDQSVVYLAWDALQSSELAGYNVYYGTVSGEYLQRRSVDRTATTLTIRDLPVGVRYYFAVRAFNAKNEETEFSQEVSVIIGQPQTSTAPLLASTLPSGPGGVAPRTGGNLAGATGISSTLLLFLFASAGIGTMLAFRRQYIVASPRHP